MISVRFQGKPFNIMVIQVYAPTCNTEEAEVEWFYEDLQDLLELTPKKDVLLVSLVSKDERLYTVSKNKALYSQQKQDRELTVAQIMSSLLPKSDLN